MARRILTDKERIEKLEKGITEMIEEMKDRIEGDKYEHSLDAFGVASGLETMINTLKNVLEK